MQPYLIRPRIEADESLFSHLTRAALCNMVSTDRMAHSIGLVNAYQLRPKYHSILPFSHVAHFYAGRFKLSLSDITRKIAIQITSPNDHLFQWHNLRLKTSDIMLSPRTCPICNIQNPGLIRDQWFLKGYVVCGYHLCSMQHRPVDKSQPYLPFTDDLIINFAKNIDHKFSGNHLPTTTLESTQNVIDQLRDKVSTELNLDDRHTNKLTPWPPKQLCLLGRPFH